MRVWVFPEKVFEEMGAVRWDVETVVTPKGWDRWTDDQRENFDPSSHPCIHQFAKTEAAARRLARKLLKRDDLSFGSVTVQKQVVDWYVEEDRIAEWANVGEPEYIDE